MYMLHIPLLLEKVTHNAYQGTVPIVSVGGELLTIEGLQQLQEGFCERKVVNYIY